MTSTQKELLFAAVFSGGVALFEIYVWGLVIGTVLGVLNLGFASWLRERLFH